MDFGDMRVVRVESPGPGSESEHRFSFSSSEACGVSRHRMWRLKRVKMYVFFQRFNKTVRRTERRDDRVSVDWKEVRVNENNKRKAPLKTYQVRHSGKDFSNLTLLPVLPQNRPDKLACVDNVPFLCFWLKSSLFYDFDVNTLVNIAINYYYCHHWLIITILLYQ